MAARFAIYAAPEPGDGLAERGAAILGYDAQSAQDRPLLVPAGFEPAEWRTLTEEPRRYGFHGTLKAPFRLAEGRSAEELDAFVARLAGRFRRIEVPLKLARLGSFFALVPAMHSDALHALADAAVRDVDPFRAQLSQAERERRMKSGLDDRQAALLDAWGYPYVFDDFRYHMTLTGRVPTERAAAVERGLGELVREVVDSPFALRSLCVFEQPGPQDRFHIRARFPLAS